MATIHLPPGNGGPVNEGERRVLQHLKEHLPDHFELHPNLQVSVGLGQLAECDIIVIGPDCVWIVEVKDLAGTVEVGEHDFIVNGEYRSHPVHVTRGKGQRIKSRLALHPDLGGVWVQPLVVLAREPRSLTVANPMKPFVVSMQRAVDVINDPSLVGLEPGRLPVAKQQSVRSRLSMDATTRKARPKYNGYRGERLLSEGGGRQWWLASHEVMGNPVWLEVVAIDALLSPAEQELQRAEAIRAAKVRTLTGFSPFLLTPENAFNADDGSVVVVHPVPPAATLGDRHDEVISWPEASKRRVVWSIAHAVGLLRSKQITHRTIGPDCIFVQANGAAKLGGLSRAGFGAATGHTVSPADWGALGANFFDAPEHATGEVTGAADVYALGRLVRYLWPDGAPADLDAAATTATAANPADRTITPKEIADIAQPPAAAAPAAPPLPPKPEAGAMFGGRYQLAEPIGSGASGTVWRATDSLNGKTVALKIFERADAGVAAQREYDALEDTAHPGVVKVRHFGSIDGRWVVISEFLDGPNLRLAMPPAVAPLSVDQAATTALRLLAALQAIHPDMPRIIELAARPDRTDEEERELDDLRLRGITHRDVKPENIILVDADRPVLVDFGLAAAGSVGEAGGTREYRPAGVSMDQADPDIDLFAVGVILHELLTGRHPYTDEDPMGGQLQIDPSLPDGVRALLARACSPRFDERFHSAQEFSAAIVALGIDEVPIDLPPPDHVELMRQIQVAMAEHRWDDAASMCPTDWAPVLGRIEARRVLDAQAEGQPPLLEVDGFVIRFVERRPFTLATNASNQEVGPGSVGVYLVSGPNGELLEICDHMADTGERWVGVGDVYETPPPLSSLETRLRMGLQERGDLLLAELRQARIKDDNGWSNLFQATAEQLDLGAGVGVGATLEQFGASAFGTRAEVDGETGPRRNYLCALMPASVEHLPAVIHFLTKVMPLAHGVRA